jgi:hypothetical protein
MYRTSANRLREHPEPKLTRPAVTILPFVCSATAFAPPHVAPAKFVTTLPSPLKVGSSDPSGRYRASANPWPADPTATIFPSF